jgi:uncharacterized membrane protein YphA (DoxX/SURF4 family)
MDRETKTHIPQTKQEARLGRLQLAYWATTVLVAAELALGGVWDLARIEYVREIFERLGYPEYLLTILGIPKIVGAAILLTPGMPRLTEWVYAGATFTYLGAVASHWAVNDPLAALITPTVFAGMTIVSWLLHPRVRTT